MTGISYLRMVCINMTSFKELRLTLNSQCFLELAQDLVYRSLSFTGEKRKPLPGRPWKLRISEVPEEGGIHPHVQVCKRSLTASSYLGFLV